MKYQYWEIETPDGLLLIENGWPSIEISMNGKLRSKKLNFALPSLLEFECNGAQYKVRIRLSANPFRNLCRKCLVERNGQLIADNPDHSGIYPRGVIGVIFVGILIGAAIIAVLVMFGL